MTGRRPSLAVKRAIDIVVSTISLLVLSVPLAAIALVVRFSMGRPILFRQSRPGMNGRLFKLFKFRSMDGEASGHDRQEQDEDRLTRTGQFLRRTSLDELPELVNVIKGDMSLVGPRPLLPEYLHRYSSRQARRHEVRPGITGWAQVNGRNALSWEERLELDVWYVDNWSLGLDFRILCMTVVQVLKREGVSAGGHATMPEFLGTDRGADGE